MKRNSGADIARGIGIILVVIGHFYAGDWINYIFSFHMPLFFFLSGYLTNEEAPYLRFLGRRAKSSLIPYTALFIISLALENVRLFYLKNAIDPFLTLRAFALSGGYLNDIPLNNFPLWYLPHYFVASAVFFAIVKLSKGRDWISALSAAILIAISVPVQGLVPGRPALHINALPASVTFMLIGHLWKKYEPEGIKKAAPYLALPALVAGYAISNFVGWAHVAHVVSPLYYLAAACSIFGVLSISERLDSPVLGFIGRNTVVFYGLHMFVFTHVVPASGLPPVLGFFAGMAALAIPAGARALIKSSR